MKKVLFLLLVLFCSHWVRAQQEYFIYIQSDTYQPFYVQWEGKNHSSSANGYVILSKIKDSTIRISIGFPKNEHPTQHVELPVNKKDAGYLLKNMGEKGFALFNLQTLQLIPATTKTDIGQSMKQGPINTNAFSVMLANVVNDSLILYANNLPEPTPIETEAILATVKKKEPETITVDSITAPIPVFYKDTLVTATPETVITVMEGQLKKDSTTIVANTIKADSTIATAPLKDSIITSAPVVVAPEPKPIPISETVAPPALVVKDSANLVQTVLPPVKAADTIAAIAAPAQNNTRQVTTIKQATAALSKETYQAVFLVTTNGITDTVDVFIERDAAITTDTLQINANNIATTLPAHCSKLATDIDVDKLRVNIIAVSTEDAKIATALKAFKQKCYEVRHLKALSELFEEESGKFRFFETAHPYTSNKEQFMQLQELFQTNYFRERMQALLLQ